MIHRHIRDINIEGIKFFIFKAFISIRCQLMIKRYSSLRIKSLVFDYQYFTKQKRAAVNCSPDKS